MRRIRGHNPANHAGESRPGAAAEGASAPAIAQAKGLHRPGLLQEALTKCSEAILARRVTADSTNKYGKVTQQRQEHFVSAS
jgi:hypothetical protein